MIKILNLNKYYNKGAQNENHVIKDLSVELPDKGLVCFFGPSGCGKTTLLNIIGCLDKFDSGSITYFDQTFTKYVPHTFDELRNHLIGYIFQNYNLIDSMSVYDNVAMPLEMLGIQDPKEKKRRIEYCLNAVGMMNYRRRNVLALSGGQRQRVAIARALAKNPKIIIADEPTGNLDSNNTFDVMNIIKKISSDRLVVLVSHEKEMVDFYADRIIELKDGVIQNDHLNDFNSGLTHSDVRNIYLKDYENHQLTDKGIDLNVFDDQKNETNIKLDVIIRDGQIYLKEIDGKTLHIIDESSEINLIDAKEEDFKKALKDNTSGFDLSELGDISTDSKKKGGFIPLHESIASGFVPSKRFLKRGVFTYIALIFSSIIFAFLFATITQYFNVDEKTYLVTSRNTVEVTLHQKDTKNSLSSTTLYDTASKVPGFLHLTLSGNSSARIMMSIGVFYQTSSNYGSVSHNVYPVDASTYPLTLAKGRTVNDNYEVVIGSWIADDILDSAAAKNNGLDSYSDLLDKTISVYFNEGFYNADKYVIVGIANEKSNILAVSNATYVAKNSMSYQGYSGFVIDCIDKEAMIKALSAYSDVTDTVKDGRNYYIKQAFIAHRSQVIAIAVMTIAIFIYLSLMIRASMFKKIKEIGVLRSVGARKNDILSIFAGEMISLTAVSSLIGFSVISLLIAMFNAKFNLSSIGVQTMVVTWWSYLIGVILIFFVNIISGLLPVVTLMHKTPVEIIKKYDI